MRTFYLAVATAALTTAANPVSAANSSSAAALGGGSCAERYALEDQYLLEWAALGGDPHAQLALSRCSGARTPSKMERDERIYAIKWMTLAACDARAVASNDRRDQRLRRLKDNADISFRRFGGLSKDEKMNWREKDFIEYRTEETERLESNRAKVVEAASPTEIASARQVLTEELSRMGPLGLARLAELSSCPAFGASKAFEAAAWSAARDAWAPAAGSGVYAAADSEDFDFGGQASAKAATLDSDGRRVAALEKSRLMRTSPQRVAELETRVETLQREAVTSTLASFALPVRSADGGLSDTAAPQRAGLTTALQFALESLGHVKFVNGPDNDYGPTTQEAVARLNRSEGRAPAKLISTAETRGAICKAALAGDPVSLYHVALMYQNGWGFAADEARAAAAIRRSETAMIEALGDADDLPEWKRAAYSKYAGEIRAAAATMKKPGLAEAGVSICE